MHVLSQEEPVPPVLAGQEVTELAWIPAQPLIDGKLRRVRSRFPVNGGQAAIRADPNRAATFRNDAPVVRGLIGGDREKFGVPVLVTPELPV